MKFTQLLAAGFAGLASAQNSSLASFTWTGTNEAGGEFGETTFPGQLGKHYTWPDAAAISTLHDRGMNTFRVAYRMERAVPDQLDGPINETYFEGLEATVNHITGLGAYAVLDPHNYGRYYGNIITDVDAWSAYWTTIASRFVSNELVVFDTNNEYHDMPDDVVRNLNQAAIDAIRAAGATSQWIFVEGNSWTGAWTWVSSGNGANLVDLTDPEDKIVYEMHQYLDEDGSGTHEECVSETIGAERLAAATQWLRENGKRGILGETAGAVNPTCVEAVTGELAFLLENADVWKGWLWWAAGPWWAEYMFSLEPPSGPAFNGLFSDIEPYIGA